MPFGLASNIDVLIVDVLMYLLYKSQFLILIVM